MTTPRKLALLALPAFAIMAFAASTASAVTVSKETAGVNTLCDTTVTEEVANNCPIRSSTNDAELGAPFGIMYACDWTLEGYVNRSGHILMTIYTVGSCEGSSLSACTTVGHRHSEMRITNLIPPGTAEAGVYNIEAEFCVTGPFGEIECHVVGTLARTSTHRYSMAFSHTNKCEDNPSYSWDPVFPLQVDAAHPGYELS